MFFHHIAHRFTTDCVCAFLNRKYTMNHLVVVWTVIMVVCVADSCCADNISNNQIVQSVCN